MLQQSDTAVATWIFQTLQFFVKKLSLFPVFSIFFGCFCFFNYMPQAVEWSSNESAMGRVLVGMRHG